MLAALLALAALPLAAVAQMTPTTPSGVVAGKTVTATWTKDTTGQWTDVTMSLMSGDNFQMVPVTTLATGIDGTATTSYTFTVPAVSPYSAIYFLQFQPAGNASAYEWTTRFLISSSDGTPTTSPANTVQPNGQAIPWGVGTLATTGGSTNSTSNTAAASSAVLASSTALATSAAAATTSASVPVVAAVSSASVQISAVGPASSASASASTSAKASGSNTMSGTSGAGRVIGAAGAGGAALAAVLLGAALLA